jgi:hypothetical protein
VDFEIDISDNIGFLRPSQIASIIQASVRAVDPALAGFTMTYGVVPGGATATYPYFVYNTGAPGTGVAFFPIAYSVGFPYPPSMIQLFNLLGIDYQNTTLAAQASGRTTYCQSIRYIDIVCNQLTYNQALKDTMSQTVARDTLCRLYLGDGPYTGTSTIDPADPAFCPPGCAPFTIYRQFTNPKFIRWLPNQPVQGNLRFQVFDDDGQPLASYTGTDVYGASSENWSMTLLVSED